MCICVLLNPIYNNNGIIAHTSIKVLNIPSICEGKNYARKTQISPNI